MNYNLFIHVMQKEIWLHLLTLYALDDESQFVFLFGYSICYNWLSNSLKAAVRDYDVRTNVRLCNKHISNMKVDPFKDWMHWMPHSFYVLGIPPPKEK